MFSLIILFAGNSTRAKINKSLSKINDKYYYQKILDLFSARKEFKQIIIVCSKENYDVFHIDENLYDRVIKIYGSDTRQQSVYESLKIVNQKFCLIHDGARPLLNSRVVDEICKSLESGIEAVVPVIKISDLLTDNNYEIIPTINLNVVQTPQGFLYSSILNAYKTNLNEIHSFRDDSSIYFKTYAKKPYFIEGSLLNQKVTFLKDIEDLNEEFQK
jgi:2-C-methyl-D-erythritol 4-phosphate cytidylyltransferase